MQEASIKINRESVIICRIEDNDIALTQRLPTLAIQHGLAHNVQLPNKRVLFPRLQQNFSEAIRKEQVKIWMVKEPVFGAGAVFLSRLTRSGRKGLQMEDIIVRECLRRKNLGTFLIEFTAALAATRHLKFISWECAKDSSVEDLYTAVGATRLHQWQPFRLGKNLIRLAINQELGNNQIAKGNIVVSDRFSIFRATSFGITGFDMNHTEGAHGLQIEDVEFDNPDHFKNYLFQTLSQLNRKEEINFVDLVLNTVRPLHMQLVELLGIRRNTYTGNPSCLWELKGQAFLSAASRGLTLLNNTGRFVI